MADDHETNEQRTGPNASADAAKTATAPAQQEGAGQLGKPADAAKLVQPTADDPDPHGIYIDAVQGHNRRYRKLLSFTHSATRAAGVMLLAAIVALVIANTGLYEGFYDFWHHNYVNVEVGTLAGGLSFAHIINDVFMALFFLLVGLEIKYEMKVGELTNIRQAALPIMGAVGGVVMPIIIYLSVNSGDAATLNGWGVPTATDIAFALGILALLGSRVPSGLRVFLSTLAVADDIIAILVIAIFYGNAPSLGWLAVAGVVYVVLIVMNRAHVFSLVPYMLVGCVLWWCVFMSGVHSTIAGVLLAFVIPSGSRVNMKSFLEWSNDRVKLANVFHDENTPIVAQKKYLRTVNSLSNVSRDVLPPVTRLEQVLHPWVYFAVLPLFALTNADVPLPSGDLLGVLTSDVFAGVFFGLVIGKPLGIMAFSFLCVKLRIAKLPDQVNWMHMLGAAILGGVGFTMAIFVANLAYADAALIAEAKLAILLASLVAGVVGFLFLFLQASKTRRREEEYRG